MIRFLNISHLAFIEATGAVTGLWFTLNKFSTVLCMISDLAHNLGHVESVFVKVSPLYNEIFLVGSVCVPPNSDIEPFISVMF